MPCVFRYHYHAIGNGRGSYEYISIVNRFPYFAKLHLYVGKLLQYLADRYNIHSAHKVFQRIHVLLGQTAHLYAVKKLRVSDL